MLFKKTVKFVKRIINNFRNDFKFSKKLAFYRLSGDLLTKLNLNKLTKSAYKAKDECILAYLKSSLSSVIDKINDNTTNGIYVDNAPIWVCWWTGEETAPPLVKRCIRSIRENAGKHPVNFIDQNNYSDYLDIPDYIINKVEANQICLANFSDYLRVSLIDKFGGLWIDATIFVSDVIPEKYFSLPFFTCKSPEEECGYISRMRWTAFVVGGWKNNVFFNYMQEMFTTYWLYHDSSIDYLLVDYLIELAYSEIPYIKNLINNVPINNTHRDNLQDAMYKALPGDMFNSVLDNDTILYKLSWRESFPTESSNKKESLYSYFINS